MAAARSRGGKSGKVLGSSLTALFVFNPTLGDEDTEGEKILFFSPEIALNAQKGFVGICEGLVNFTREFSPEQPCEAVRCERHRYALFEAETNYWIVLVVSNPCMVGENGRTSYLENDLEDSVLQAIVRRAYSFFRLFRGRMTDIMNQGGKGTLVHELKLFMHHFIPTIRFKQLRCYIDIHGFQFLPVDGQTFLAIQLFCDNLSKTFPCIQSTAVTFAEQLVWSGIHQDDMFLLNYVQQDSTQLFYTYLCLLDSDRGGSAVAAAAAAAASLSPAAAMEDVSSPMKLETELYDAQDESDEAEEDDEIEDAHGREGVGATTTSASGEAAAVEVKTHHNEGEATRRHEQPAMVSAAQQRPRSVAGFQTGPLTRGPQGQGSPLLFLRDDHAPISAGACYKGPLRRARLVVYSVGGLSLLLTLEDKERYTDPSFYSSLESFMATDLQKLTSALRQQALRLQDQEESFRFLYFNRMSLALKTSASMKSVPLSMDVIKVIRSMHRDFSRAFASKNKENSASEVCVRTRSHGWVIGRRADETHREFFVLVDDKFGTLTEVQEEIDRLARTYFYNIFIQ